jgi:hypothetical protein
MTGDRPLLPPSNTIGQVSGYHQIKTLAPDFVPRPALMQHAIFTPVGRPTPLDETLP